MKMSRLLCPMRYRWLRGRFPDGKFKVLDVGCGHLSCDTFRAYYPAAEYHGVDKRLNDEPEHYQKMDQFFDVDLDSGNLSSIPGDAYDAIVFSHTIEHLHSGHEVLAELVKKLKLGGYLYVEFPAVESMYFPSGEGTLNFFDDPTHIRLYDTKEIANILLAQDVRILGAGKATTWIRRLLITPAGILYNIYHVLRFRKLSAKGLLDAFGFARYVLGMRHGIPEEHRAGNWSRTIARAKKRSVKLSSEASSTVR
jgi:SAM-dependent methyltransferase